MDLSLVIGLTCPLMKQERHLFFHQSHHAYTLIPYTTYVFTITASIDVGYGPYSTAFVIRTLEEGTIHYYIHDD